jgi:diguanylate cyclase (GGDEF)-like protein
MSSDPARDEALRALDDARSGYYERPAAALAVAASCHELGIARADAVICARARALQAAISVHRGDVRGALALAVEAERQAESDDDVPARAETSAITAQVGFFAGSHAAALGAAERAVALADESGDLALRVWVRRATCPIYGNLAVRDLEGRIRALLELALELDDRWEEAISRNDLACFHQGNGDVAAAEAEIERARRCAEAIRTESRFAHAVILSTRADIALQAGRPADALEDARRSLRLLGADGEPNPYVLAATVRAEVQARLALGQLEDARETGEGALRWLGDRVPQLRSVILSTLATELRSAGLVEEAYDALSRSAELERQAFQELTELQLRLERASLEAHAARRESETLAAKNRELARMHAELADRAGELERLQDQLREQADRDWLTGLHNRRFLARTLGPATELPMPLTIAVLDLDHFKSVNDRFGHGVGDGVLVRVARLLGDALRSDDVVVRNGGEEFLMLMPSTGLPAGAACAERIREAIEREDWSSLGSDLGVTASVGLAVAERSAELEAAARLADERLYEAKRRGRNCVVGHSETASAGSSRS